MSSLFTDEKSSWLRLPAGLKDDLDWSEQKESAEKILSAGKLFFWELDFQFHRLSSHDTSAFFAYARAVEEFVKFSACYQERTLGVCLYRGPADFNFLIHPLEWEEAFIEWLEDLTLKASPAHELKNCELDALMRSHYFRLFSADVIAEYLHRLVSFLPDALQPFAFFTIEEKDSTATLAQMFSAQRFNHLQVGFEGRNCRLPAPAWLSELPTTGIYLPSDPYCDRGVLAKIDSLIPVDSPYRILCEERLTEEWNGLDKLLVVEETVSPQGRRKIQGFCAAGGEVVFI